MFVKDIHFTPGRGPNIVLESCCAIIMAYQVPHKAILSQEQLKAFQESNTHKLVVSYIETLNESVVGAKLTDECEASKVGSLSACRKPKPTQIFRVSLQF